MDTTIDEIEREDGFPAEPCLDCGKQPGTVRQPWRGVWLCPYCYNLDLLMDE